MKRIGIFIVLVLGFVLAGSTAFAVDGYSYQNTERYALHSQIVPYYNYTDDIVASLSFNGNTAKCYGSVSPTGNDSVSVTVTLYKKEGSKWSYVDSWSGNASGGATATASGSATVGKGTYKVVTAGNVGGKEAPTKSVTRTK